MAKRLIVTILAIIIYSSLPSSTYAQQTSFTLNKASNQYTTFGTVSLTKSGETYTYSAVVKDLPTTLPNGGIYYILWGLTKDGKADNLKAITNNSEVKGTLNQPVTQFFITSEKERVPEYVIGTRIAQTDTIPASTFTTTTPTSTPSISPKASASGIPVGGPTGAPETGLGGSTLWNGMIISLGAIGFTGLSLSLKKKLLG
jgi:hypothetical protein